MHSFAITADMFRSQSAACRYQTASLPEGRDYIRRHSIGHELRPPRKVSHFLLEHMRMDVGRAKIDFIRIDCNEDFTVDQVQELGFYTCKIPVSGQCEYRIGRQMHMASPGQIFASNPFEPIRKRFIGPYAQAIVRIDRQCLDDLVSTELGEPIDQPIRFEVAPLANASTALLANLIGFLWTDLEGGGASRHWRVQRHFERVLLMALLRGVPNSYSAELEKHRDGIAPYYVRKAEAFIRSHLEEPITIEDIVDASGASSRSLYYGFRRWRQTTPMTYLKRVRLDRAREELEIASVNGGSVTDIAIRVGYNYISRFSADYKARFGEKPSETLLGRHTS